MSSSVPRHSGKETIPSIFTWSIANFSTITEDTYSDILVISGYQWRLNIFLAEFISDGRPTLQIDLLVELSSTLPHGWSRDAKFDLSVVDQVSSQYTRQEEKQHIFKERNYDGGFSLIIPSSDLYDHRKGFIMNDTLIINAGVYVTKLPVVDTFILKPPAGDQENSVFSWSIKNFSRVYEHYTKVFVVGGYEWQAMVDVFDHKTSELPPNLTIRLQLANSAQLSHGWNRYTAFNFSVVDQVSGRHTMRGDGQHKFDARTLRVDGLVVPLSDLWDPRKGFLVDDTLIIEVGILDYSTRIRLEHDNHLPEQLRPGPKAPLNDILIPNSPVSAAQADTTCTWTIKNFSRVITKHHSQVFVVGGYEWRATIYLDDRGKPGFRPPNLTTFLGVANSAQLSHGWSRDTKFSFSVVDQVSSRYTLRKEGKHKFEAKGLRAGLVTVSLSDLWNPSRGFLVDDTLLIEIEIDPNKTRLTPRNNCPSQQPNKPNSIKPTTKCNLSNILEPIDGPSTSATHLTAPPSCVICMDAPSEGACVPCGHMAGCMSCLKEIKGKNMGCPVCRAKIQLVVQIYSI